MAEFGQLLTALVERLAPAASSSAGRSTPSSCSAPAAITVISLAPVFVRLGSAEPLIIASAASTELPSSAVSISALPVLPRDHPLFR